MSNFDSIKLVDYSRKEDWVNSITHMLGAVFAIVVLCLCITRGIERNRVDYILLSIVYSVTMLAVFVCSSVYHALKPSKAKKVMRVVDHAMRRQFMTLPIGHSLLRIYSSSGSPNPSGVNSPSKFMMKSAAFRARV